MRCGRERGEQLHPANRGPEHGASGDDTEYPPGASLIGARDAPHRKGSDKQQRPPERLRVPEEYLRAGQQADGGNRPEALGPRTWRLLFTCALDHPQQPGDVRDHGDQVRVDDVREGESAERKREGANHG